MKRVFVVLIILLCGTAMLLSGCSRPKGEATIEGLVYWMENTQFLVVSGIENTEIPYDEWFASGEHPAIVFTVTPSTRIRIQGRYGSVTELVVGTRVKVWADGGIAKSYPGQATTSWVEVLHKNE